MSQKALTASSWAKNVICLEERDRYLKNGKDFINDELIKEQIEIAKNPEKERIRAIIAKSLEIQRLNPEETAALINVTDPDLRKEMEEAAGEVKRRVYDNRIVTFAPLYLSNYCINNCLYCGFRKDNSEETRRCLSMENIRKEVEALAKIGHKRLIVVYGEHPLSDANYMAESIRTIYDVNVPTKGKGTGQIRRVNINAAPLSIENYKKMWDAGIGTYQIFQETYNHDIYKIVHPSGIKADYRWRLYALHRAMEAGIDDVATGALFGLSDWKFEVMGLLYHAIDLEENFGGLGPHTVSFPRLNIASGVNLPESCHNPVSDDELARIITVLRLSIPYTGMILTARETSELRKRLIPLGVTQTDASTRIGIGSYSAEDSEQKMKEQQFMLRDTRSLDEMIEELADNGMITSFCTAGYRCGRTGNKIMNLLKTGTEGKFCKLNAVLTYLEWLDDFADESIKAKCQKIVESELKEIEKDPYYKKGKLLDTFKGYVERVKNGERDVYI